MRTLNWSALLRMSRRLRSEAQSERFVVCVKRSVEAAGESAKETRPLSLKMVQFTLSNCIGTKRTVSVEKIKDQTLFGLGIMVLQKRNKRYALCIDNGGYPESLDVRKVYPILPDKRAEANNYIRVIDETGEDYLYPAKYFVLVEVPRQAAQAMLAHKTSLNLRAG